MKENFFTKIMLVHCAVKIKAEVFCLFYNACRTQGYL